MLLLHIHNCLCLSFWDENCLAKEPMTAAVDNHLAETAQILVQKWALELLKWHLSETNKAAYFIFSDSIFFRHGIKSLNSSFGNYWKKKHEKINTQELHMTYRKMFALLHMLATAAVSATALPSLLLQLLLWLLLLIILLLLLLQHLLHHNH